MAPRLLNNQQLRPVAVLAGRHKTYPHMREGAICTSRRAMYGTRGQGWRRQKIWISALAFCPHKRTMRVRQRVLWHRQAPRTAGLTPSTVCETSAKQAIVPLDRQCQRPYSWLELSFDTVLLSWRNAPSGTRRDIMATAFSPRDERPGNGPVVLLVESDGDNREMYAGYLRTCGFTVRTADTTDDGLTLAGEADVVVTEILVDGSFDGIELVHRLCGASDISRPVVIVLTACASERDQQIAHAAGCHRFLTKPCLPDHLESTIRAISSVAAP
jgi:CheY-like chemotaxis protein